MHWIIFYCLVVWGLGSSIKSLEANHLTGGEMNYSYVQTLPDGRQVYEIVTTIYRDALSGGADFDNPLYMTVYNMDNLRFPKNKRITFFRSNMTYVPLNDLGPCAQNVPRVSIQKGIYTALDTVEINNGGYTYAHQRCCRSDVISNLFIPGDQGSTYSVHLTKEAMLANNSSPTFDQEAPILICVQSNFEYQFKATDADGHTLRYSLCEPYLGGNNYTNDGVRPTTASQPPYTPVQYSNGYNAWQPFGANVPVILDDETGKLSFRPDRVGKYTIAICIEELDENNQSLGYVKRDLMFNVANCAVASSGPYIEGNEVYEGVFATCRGQTIKFRNRSQGASSYFWDFGVDNETSILREPTFTFNDPGEYEVKLVINRGEVCADSASMKIRIFPILDADFSYNVSCEDQSASFESLSTSTTDPIVEELWTINNKEVFKGNFFTHQFNSDGNYTVKLQALTEKGCLESESKVIQVPKYNPANFEISNQDNTQNTIAICGSNTIEIRSLLAANIDKTWLIDGENIGNRQRFNHTFADTGTYRIDMITNSLACPDTMTKWVRILPEIDLSFAFETFCQSVPVQFEGKVDRPYDPVQTWSWSFGDKTSSELQSPVKTFADSKTYQVSLEVETIHGCTGKITEKVTIPADVVSDFEITGQSSGGSYIYCEDLPIHFTSKSKNAETLLWNFGAGIASSTDSKVDVIYPSAGQYFVSLIAQKNDFCSDTITKSIQLVDEITQVDFEIKDLCAHTSQTITNKSVSLKNDFDSYYWDFGDGTFSSQKNPKKIFTDEGTYTVKLVVGTKLGCQDSISKKVTIHPVPVADFETGTICAQGTQELINTSSISKGSIDSYQWTWRKQTSTDKNATFTFGQAGDEGISLIVTSNQGCQHSIQKQAYVNSLPTVDFNLKQLCVDEEVELTSQSKVTDGEITQWLWDFENGQANGEQVQHLFARDGIQDVTLTATSSLGCQNSRTKQVDITPHPNADFVLDGVDLGSSSFVKCDDAYSVQFNNLSVNNPTNIWAFDAYGNSSEISPSFVFPDTGSYTVELTINPGTLCSDTKQVEVQILPELYVDFELSPVCEGQEITLNDQSHTVLNNINQQTWIIQDSITLTGSEVRHTLDQTDDLSVLLIIETSRGCIDSLRQTTPIYDIPEISIGDFEICPAQDTRMVYQSLGKGRNAIDESLWNLGDWGTYSEHEAVINIEKPGVYEYYLEVMTKAGCENFAKGSITVREYLEPAFEHSPHAKCVDYFIAFDATHSKGIHQSYFWDFDGAGTSTQAVDSIAFGYEDNYLVTLTISDTLCGEKSISKEIAIIESPTLSLGDDFALCPNLTAELNLESNQELGTIKWSTGDSNTYTISVLGNVGLVSAIGYNEEGCHSEASIIITPSCAVNVPQAFSPNGDGTNDFFNALPANIEFYELVVYNRWGHEIFRTNDFAHSWDGTYQGIDQPMDNYIYYLSGKKIDGTDFTLKGHVLLIR